ncbi:hypothetical protein B9479_005784 [Cryptococcus floricola]|uniref:Major facilitator superfamily (MFS) profile domain-containing protein n=1 Tax=Cryptococcus floricola TaxID=2591691 RepID=A0A5D3ATL4_9TREE|nr:hypothetical protein B9479_005784 [Cryptococcus floricola]
MPSSSETPELRQSRSLVSLKSSPASLSLSNVAGDNTTNTTQENESPSTQHPLAQLSPLKKSVLLFIFGLADFLDIANVSGVAVAVADITTDISLHSNQGIWIITSYSIGFSAFLLLSGRLADLFPAGIVFEVGFASLGILSLVTSFVTSNKYGFLILRGLAGISGSLTIPSAYHLVIHMYPETKEQASRLSLLGLAAGLGNVFGLVLAGLCMRASYKWFFRLIAILCLLSTAVAIWLLPFSLSSTYSKEKKEGKESIPRWQMLDAPGVVLMTGFLTCFILSLTQGPIDGWGAVSFIVPFVICWPCVVGFFFWEAKISQKIAILPNSVWSITNSIIASLAVLIPMGFWGTSQLMYANYWQTVYGWSPLHVAVACLPQGVMTLIIGGMVQFVPAIIEKPRWSIPIGSILIVIAEVLQLKSEGGHGTDYWRFIFPAFVLGSAGGMIVIFASQINLVQMCPPEMAGVAAAWISVLFQVGGALTLAVMSGLESTNPSTFMQSGAKVCYFIIGYTIVLAGIYVGFYKTPKSLEEEHKEARERIRKRDGDGGGDDRESRVVPDGKRSREEEKV